MYQREKKSISENKQTFWLASGKIIALLATLVVPLFLTRFLDKEEYGFYSQFNTILYFLISFFSFGMYSNLFYFYNTLKSSDRKLLIIQTFLFLLFFSLFAALFIFIPGVNSFFLGNGSLKDYKMVIYLLTIILILTSIVHPLYVVNKDIGFSLWFPSFQVVMKAIFIVSFFLLIPSIQSVINAILVSSILVFIIVLIYLKKVFKNLPKGDLFNKNIAIEQLKYNLPIGFSVAIKTFAQRFDKLVSLSYLSTSAYASYSIAFFGIPGIQQIYDSISQVTVIGMSKHFSNGDKTKALQLYKKMVVKTFSFSVPIIFIVALNAEQIITFLFTNKYQDATLLFQMYLISFIFVMLGAGLILRASANTRYSVKAFLYSSVITIPSTYFLIKNFGTIGAMSGALLSIILPKFYQIKKEIDITESNFTNFLPWKEMGEILLISLVLLVPFYYLNMDNIISIIIFSTVYLISVFMIEIKLDIFIVERTELISLRKKYFKF